MSERIRGTGWKKKLKMGQRQQETEGTKSCDKGRQTVRVKDKQVVLRTEKKDMMER